VFQFLHLRPNSAYASLVISSQVRGGSPRAGHMLGERLLPHHGLGVSFMDDGRQPFPRRRD
jgi:hypothetical protein